jgi:hypothetical protein
MTCSETCGPPFDTPIILTLRMSKDRQPVSEQAVHCTVRL